MSYHSEICMPNAAWCFSSPNHKFPCEGDYLYTDFIKETPSHENLCFGEINHYAAFVRQISEWYDIFQGSAKKI